MTEIPVDELRALLAEPLDRFVAARTERVKALRTAGRREEAALLATVRKPSRLAARVAVLARVDPDAAAGAVQAAEDLESAQLGDGDLRESMAALRPAIDAVLATAPITDRVDLGLPLRTVLADADAREAWLDGLLAELPGPGIPSGSPAPGPHLTLVPTGPDVVPTKRSKGATKADAETAAHSTAAQRAAEQRAVAQREAARRELQAKFDGALAAVGSATSDLDHAVAARAEADERASKARRELEDAEIELATANGDVTDAEQRLAALRQAADQARTALDGS